MSRNPAQNRQHISELRVRRHAKNSRVITHEKAKGCSCCSRKDIPHRNLHFDHFNPLTKKASIADMRRGSTSALIAEIRKCRLICLGCHRDRHQAARPDRAA